MIIRLFNLIPGLAGSLAILMLTSFDVVADQGEPASPTADRPVLTASAQTVPPRRLQIELGGVFATAGQGNEITLPDLLLRLGVMHSLELRLDAPALVVHSYDCMSGPRRNGRESGILPVGDRAYDRAASFTYRAGDLGIGAKAVLPVGNRWTLGALPVFAIPVQKQSLEMGGLTIGAIGIWAVKLSSRTLLEGNIGVVVYGITAKDTDPAYLASMKAGSAFNETLSGTIEIMGFADKRGSFNSMMNSSLVARVNEQWQIDFSVGVGLDSIATWSDIITGIGVAWLSD